MCVSLTVRIEVHFRSIAIASFHIHVHVLLAETSDFRFEIPVNTLLIDSFDVNDINVLPNPNTQCSRSIQTKKYYFLLLFRY